MRIPIQLLVIAFAACPCGTAARADDWSKRWSVSGKPELRISTGDASVTIEVGSANEIEAVVKTRGVSIGEAGVKIDDHQDGNRVELEIRERSSHFSFGMHSVELRVRVPKELTANVHTGDGSIKLSGLHGSLQVNTGDGSVQGDDLDGALDARSGDGSMHVRGRFDSLQIRTSDGSVDVQAASGSQMHSDWRVETGDGSVRLGVPHNLSANVQLKTGDGSIHVDLPLTVEGTKGEHDVRGKLNGGGPFLDVRTGDGSISLNSI
ncbi:MAG: DUF4097 domain-containing protein [Acidobacteriota bacterium]|nr:DUF4097 domain-containing protein [Acidobacteriota bacterium]